MARTVKILFINITLLLSGYLITAERLGDNENIAPRFNVDLILYMKQVFNELNCNFCRVMFGVRCAAICSAPGALTTSIPATTPAPATTTTLPPCPVSAGDMTVFTKSGKYYAYITTVATWDAAKLRCESLGMHLVTFETQADFDDVYYQVKYYNGGASYDAWIGMRGSGTSTPLTYTYILNNTPNTVTWASSPDKTQQCGTMQGTVTGGSTNGVNSAVCTLTKTFACELETPCA